MPQGGKGVFSDLWVPNKRRDAWLGPDWPHELWLVGCSLGIEIGEFSVYYEKFSD